MNTTDKMNAKKPSVTGRIAHQEPEFQDINRRHKRVEVPPTDFTAIEQRVLAHYVGEDE